MLFAVKVNGKGIQERKKWLGGEVKKNKRDRERGRKGMQEKQREKLEMEGES